MDLTRQIDAYCERMDPGFWAEPINAVTNLAFILAALIMWRRSAGIPATRWLCVVLFAIGIGSFLFHTYAQTWAALADVIPIGVFVLSYIWLANRVYLGLSPLWAAIATAAFFPYVALAVPLFGMIPGIGSSAGYAPVALMIGAYGVWLLPRLPEVGRGLVIGAAILTVSITLRALDLPLCDAKPIGTHYWWHLLNGVMLGWMIEVYRRHVGAVGLAGGLRAR